MNELAGSAIEYARLGWPVLALMPRDKPPEPTLCPHGLNDATTDEKIIAMWWRKVPDANVGLRTGVAFDVLDIDGPDARDELITHGQFDKGPIVRTSRGWHAYFLPAHIGNKNALIHHVDYRSDGGYVVAPPSVHASGAVYQWEMAQSTPLTPMPDWLEAMVNAEKVVKFAPRPISELSEPHDYAKRALERKIDDLVRAPEGQRNHSLNAAAYYLGRIVAVGLLERDRVYWDLLGAAERMGLGAYESHRTILSGLTKGIANPRPVSRVG